MKLELGFVYCRFLHWITVTFFYVFFEQCLITCKLVYLCVNVFICQILNVLYQLGLDKSVFLWKAHFIHSGMKILSSFIHPRVFPKLYGFTPWNTILRISWPFSTWIELSPLWQQHTSYIHLLESFDSFVWRTKW